MNEDYCDKPSSLSSKAYEACSYVLEEIKSGVVESFTGVTSIITNPIGCFKGIFTMIRHPVITAQVIGREAYNHPIRFATKLAISYGTGAAISAAVTSVTDALHVSQASYAPPVHHSVTATAVALEASKQTLSTAHATQGTHAFRHEHSKHCIGDAAKNGLCFFPSAPVGHHDTEGIEMVPLSSA